MEYLGLSEGHLCFKHGPGNVYHRLDVCEIYLSDFKISYAYLKISCKVKLVMSSDKVKVILDPSNFLYVAIVYDFIQVKKEEIVFVCKRVECQKKIKKIKLWSLKYYNNAMVTLDDPIKFIGRPILVDKENKSYTLLVSEEHAKSKVTAQDFFEKIVKSVIVQSEKYYFKTKHNQKMTKAEFYYYNKIALDIADNYFIGKAVDVITKSGRCYFRINNPCQKFGIVEISSCVYDSFFGMKLNLANDFNCYRHSFQSLGISINEKDFSNYFISHQCFNNNLSSIISLAIIEHIFRFQKDNEFISYIKNYLDNANVIKYYKDLPIHNNNNRNISSLISCLFQNIYPLNIIGTTFIPQNTENNILKVIQSISNNTGFCIHFVDFTEGYEEYKLVPLIDKIKVRPVVKLGRYFSSYFIIYSDIDMQIDGFDYQGNHKFPLNYLNLKISPHYDCYTYIDFNYLDNFFKKICNHFQEIIDEFKNKMNGTSTINSVKKIDIEVQNLKDHLKFYFGEENFTGLDMIAHLTFEDIIYFATPQKYYCCHCGNYFNENEKTKKTLPCKHDYNINHIANIGPQQCFMCNYNLWLSNQF